MSFAVRSRDHRGDVCVCARESLATKGSKTTTTKSVYTTKRNHVGMAFLFLSLFRALSLSHA